MAKKLEGKVAIVTGSGQGVGKGIAVGLAREGARLVINDLKPASSDQSSNAIRNEADKQKYLSLKSDAEKTASEINSEGGEAIHHYANVCDQDAVKHMIDATMDAFGRVDIVVNNAAGLFAGPLLETSDSDWEYVTVAKMKGTFNVMRHAAPVMAKQKFGRFVNVSSYAWMGLEGLAAYSAANAGVVGMTKAVAKELHRAGITANVICPEADSPGHVREFSALKTKLSAMGVEIPEFKLKEIRDAHGPAENLAPFVAYLSTEEASYITGAVFAVTGGGNINYFTDSVMVKEGLSKSDGIWTVEELIKLTPEKLLKDYKSVVALDEHRTQKEDF